MNLLTLLFLRRLQTDPAVRVCDRRGDREHAAVGGQLGIRGAQPRPARQLRAALVAQPSLHQHLLPGRADGNTLNTNSYFLTSYCIHILKFDGEFQN